MSFIPLGGCTSYVHSNSASSPTKSLFLEGEDVNFALMGGAVKETKDSKTLCNLNISS